MTGTCRLSHVPPKRYDTVNGAIMGSHEVMVLIEADGEHYRLNAEGDDSEVLRILYQWVHDSCGGGWFRNRSAFMFEQETDAFAFLMRWQGAQVPFPEY